jgi:hypothetical protein
LNGQRILASLCTDDAGRASLGIDALIRFSQTTALQADFQSAAGYQPALQK